MDEAFIRQAIEESDPNALRIALLQATGDPQIAAMKVDRIVARGGTGIGYRVTDEDRARLLDKAMAFLTGLAANYRGGTPDDATLKYLMEQAVGGQPLSDEEFSIRKPIPAFDDYPRTANWHGAPAAIPEGFVVAIIGAGFSGLGMAVQLQRLGIPYVIFERRHEIGGTWSINTYPDARVDTPSAMYEFTFEKRFPWTEHFARAAEVRAYLDHIAHKFGIFPNIRFNHSVVAGRFDEEALVWHLDVTDETGCTNPVRVNCVVSASGLFSTARKLSVEGLEAFEGEVVHTTEWNETHSTAGKSVAIVGNGSTGVQLLGRVAEDADQVHVFQRTPQWIAPRERYGEPMSPGDAWMREHMPHYWNWTRYIGALPSMSLYEFLIPDRNWQAAGGLVNEPNDTFRELLTQYLTAQVEGRQDLIEKLVPDYAPFSRRLIVDNGWYRALLRDNVELVTAQIAKVGKASIVTEDGVERPVDMIITATGFSVERYVWPAEYVGRGGVRLQDRWEEESPRAYLGMMVDGFPNFFVLYGPNSQSVSGGGGTIPAQIEMWTKYAAQAIVDMLENDGVAIEVTKAAFEDYNERLDEEAKNTIWLADTGSIKRNYYVGGGRLQVNIPWKYQEWHHMLSKPRLEDMTLSRTRTRTHA